MLRDLRVGDLPGQAELQQFVSLPAGFGDLAGSICLGWKGSRTNRGDHAQRTADE